MGKLPPAASFCWINLVQTAIVYVQTKPDLLGLSGQSLDILNHVIQINSSFKNEGTWSRVRVIYSYCHWGTVSDLIWHHRAVPWAVSQSYFSLSQGERASSLAKFRS